MKKTSITTIAAILLSLPSLLHAQNLTSAYFADGYAYGHQLNPAKEYDRKGYFSLPFLPSNLNVAMRGNLGLSDILYKNPNGKGLVTYLHPSLSKKEALSGFSANNKLLTDFHYDLFSFGFHSGKSTYQTFTMGLRSHAGVNLPGDLFSMTRELTNKDYNFSSFGANAQVWAEAGWGYSRDVLGILRIGAKVKLLMGLGYADLHMDRLDLNLANENRWTAIANATLEVGVPGFSWGEPEIKEYTESYRQHYAEKHPGQPVPTHYESVSFDNVEAERPHLSDFSNLGAAIDLGVEADMSRVGIKGLKLGASLLDLGFIHYSNVAMAQNKGQEFEFDGFHDIQVGDGPGVDIEDQWDELGDRFEDLICLQDGGRTSTNKALGATLNLSGEYTLPFCPKVAVGLLSSSRLQGKYSWNEERISLNFHPWKSLELIANVGAGTLGTSFGWMINFHPRVISIFLGSDHFIGKVSKQYVPLRSNADLAMGINFPIGKSKASRKRDR